MESGYPDPVYIRKNWSHEMLELMIDRRLSRQRKIEKKYEEMKK